MIPSKMKTICQISRKPQKSDGKYCTKPNFHPVNQVHELWFAGIESITGGENVLGVQAQHPNAIGHQDSIESWPIPDDPEARDYPLPGTTKYSYYNLHSQRILSLIYHIYPIWILILL